MIQQANSKVAIFLEIPLQYATEFRRILHLKNLRIFYFIRGESE